MKKTLCGKVYDTDASTLVKKYTFGYPGDDDGYEESLYETADGFMFLYVNGGASSVHPKEDIKRISKDKATKWLEGRSKSNPIHPKEK